MTSLLDFSGLHHTSLGPPGISNHQNTSEIPGQDAQASMSPSPNTSALGNLRLVELNSSKRTIQIRPRTNISDDRVFFGGGKFFSVSLVKNIDILPMSDRGFDWWGDGT